jgi:hypothetical protein
LLLQLAGIVLFERLRHEARVPDSHGGALGAAAPPALHATRFAKTIAELQMIGKLSR